MLFLNFLWFGLVVAFLAFMASETKYYTYMALLEFLLQINLSKVKKLWKSVFSPLAFALTFRICLAFFQFSCPLDVLSILNYENLSYFEAILPLKHFFAENLENLINVWQLCFQKITI